ncbi:serine/threonine-protein kinase PBS1 [Vigna unguiculata]|uniref:non-specific serine/threonine protein kinase n=1 Tax=Vigna unguiculata TaxID=3917 RepID=A0A4D6MEA4_VIGUN|nr:serine/threonine-protein kinase PBS1 [Vigna unguiculata]
MKRKLLLFLLMLLLILHKPISTLASPYPFAPSPQVPPFSPFPNSMSASSPGIVMGAEQRQMDSHKKMVIAIAIASTSLGAVILSVLCIWIYHTKYPSKSKGKNVQRSDAEKGLTSAPTLSKFSSIKLVGKKGCVPIIDYKQIEKATGNYKESNILGEGGFGCVYKARLEDNLEVAVKKLHCENPCAEQEFENEVELLSKIQHPNVISLLGCSSNEDTRIIVYELMHNGSLETQLHGPSHGSALTWHLRMKIALDTARGLKYLHEHCYPAVIHRDLKSSNILLDTKFNAKLSDFGLAITNGTQNKNNIKLSGTLGYVAPEYLLDGMFLEHEKQLLQNFNCYLFEAMPQLTDRSKLPNIVDPVIKDTMDPKHLYQVAAVAVLCVQPEPSYRPLIADVLHSLIPLVPVELGGTLKVAQLPQQVLPGNPHEDSSP